MQEGELVRVRAEKLARALIAAERSERADVRSAEADGVAALALIARGDDVLRRRA